MVPDVLDMTKAGHGTATASAAAAAASAGPQPRRGRGDDFLAHDVTTKARSGATVFASATGPLVMTASPSARPPPMDPAHRRFRRSAIANSKFAIVTQNARNTSVVISLPKRRNMIVEPIIAAAAKPTESETSSLPSHAV